MTNKKYPADLATVVFKRIHNDKSITQNVLSNLFETMYHASFKTEEGEAIKFGIIYGDIEYKSESDKFIKSLITPLLFHKSKAFTVKNIVKIAKATDLKSSSIIISSNNLGGLEIIGIYDQEAEFYGYLVGDNAQPAINEGIIKASTNEPGQISVYYKNEKIADLVNGQIIDQYQFIFSVGNPIYDAIHKCISNRFKTVKFIDELTDAFFEVFCKILSRIKNFKHGGGIIFSNNNILSGNLSTQYELEGKGYGKLLPMIYYFLKLRNDNNDSSIAFAQKEIDKIIWNIALLSRIDGAVLFDFHLNIKSFGVKIDTDSIENHFTCKKCKSIGADELSSFNLNLHGTRHLSMAKLCNQFPGTIGVVISQDGDIRLFMNYEKELLVWEDISLRSQKSLSTHEAQLNQELSKMKKELRISKLEAFANDGIETTLTQITKTITMPYNL